MEYKIIYDFDDSEGYTSRNCVDYFTGTWLELQDYIKRMKNGGAYNIEANALKQD